MIHDTYGHCVAKQKATGLMFIVGGYGWIDSNGNPFRTGTQVLDTETMTFSLVSSQMAFGRLDLACAVLEDDELLIAAGGTGEEWIGIDVVEILDLQTKTWSNAGVMPNKKQVWTAGEFFFLLGSQLYQYESNSDQWLEIVDPPLDVSKMQRHFVPVNAGIGNFCPFL